MIGFVPGFPYLGGMSPRIVTPRLETPRAKITAGSVGIAGNQTGIYPVESPGGWRLIGRTPLKLFDPIREPLELFQAGDYLTFVSITPEEFSSIKEAVEQQTYLVKETLLE
jgi:KipI family sensor histidine kinase inhibitor